MHCGSFGDEVMVGGGDGCARTCESVAVALEQLRGSLQRGIGEGDGDNARRDDRGENDDGEGGDEQEHVEKSGPLAEIFYDDGVRFAGEVVWLEHVPLAEVRVKQRGQFLQGVSSLTHTCCEREKQIRHFAFFSLVELTLLLLLLLSVGDLVDEEEDDRDTRQCRQSTNESDTGDHREHVEHRLTHSRSNTFSESARRWRTGVVEAFVGPGGVPSFDHHLVDDGRKQRGWTKSTRAIIDSKWTNRQPRRCL